MSTDSIRIPYPGPRPFETEETPFFFGRERELRDLSSLVIAHRAVLLYAQSGSGKTSLLKAGLVPLLEKEGTEVLPIARVQGVEVETLGVQSVTNIYAFNALLCWAGDDANPQTLATMSVAQFLSQRDHAHDKHGDEVMRVAIFDQFEELFTAYPEHWKERRALIAQLGEACEADPLLRIVLVIREDHLAELVPHSDLLPESLRASFRLEALGEEAAIASVEKPLRGTTRSFGEEVAKNLVKRLLLARVEHAAEGETPAEAQYVEPVQLQVVCRRLWQQLPDDVKVITDQQLQAFGDVEEALRSFYENAVEATAAKSGVSEGELRRWFERQLITPAGTRGTVFQGATTTGKIPNFAVQVLEDDHHIVRAELRHGSRWYELTHDRLVAPIRESNAAWFASDERRKHRWMVFAIIAAVGVVSFAIQIGITQLNERDADQKLARELARQQSEFDKKFALERQAAQLKIESEAKFAAEKLDMEKRERNALEEADRFPAEVQMARLRADRNLGRWSEKRAESVIDGVANYLWAKGEIDRLASILKKNHDLVPERYGLDETALSLTPTVEDGVGWPLTVEYSSRTGLDKSRFLYHWRYLAALLVNQSGVPLPLRVKISQDDNLPAGEFRILSAYTLGEAQGNSMTIEERASVRIDSSQVAVSRRDAPKNLAPFFDKYKISSLPQLPVMDLWLFPAWTQPVWKAAGHRSFDREGIAALKILSDILDRPDLVLNRDSVGYLLDRLAKTHPVTVREALAMRGIDRLVEDLRQIVAKYRHPLTNLEYLLDSLANAGTADSTIAAERAVDDLKFIARPNPDALPGTPVANHSELEALKTSIRGLTRAYRESSSWLAEPAPPIRIFVGDALRKQLAPDGGLSEASIEDIDEIRRSFIRRFGFSPPSIRFSSDAKLAPGAFRIEVAGSITVASRVVPTAAGNERLSAALSEEIANTFTIYRDWWLTPDNAAALIAELPEDLQNWLHAHYSLTDLKLILSGVVKPTREELKAYQVGDLKTALGIRPEQTLDRLDWLMRSLVFVSAAAPDEHSVGRVASSLRWLQHLRLAGDIAGTESDTTANMVAAGIEDLRAEGRIDLASKEFLGALARDRKAAIGAFLSLYVIEGKRDEKPPLLASECALPKPGEVAKDATPSRRTRIWIEAFLDGANASIPANEQRQLELCLLRSAVADKSHQKVAQLHRQLSSEYRPMEWSPEEQYLLAYLLVKEHGRTILPPAALAEIEQLLRESFPRLSIEDAEAAFLELLQIYESALSTPHWYAQVLRTLPSAQPKSFWIPYYLASWLTDARSLSDARESLALLETASSRLGSLDPDDRPRLQAWLELGRARALVAGGQFEQDAPKRSGACDEAVRRVEGVLRRVPAGAERWPSLDDLYGALVSAHYAAGRPDDIARAVDAWLVRVADSEEAAYQKSVVHLARLEEKLAVELARRAYALAKSKGLGAETQGGYLKVVAMFQTLTGLERYEEEARRFINDTANVDRDFVRVLLYWRLKLEGHVKDADELIDERIVKIAPDSWSGRLEQGDATVWGEKIVSLFAGRTTRERLQAELGPQESFAATPLGRAGFTYQSRLVDVYFYWALLRNVSGEAKSRDDFLEGLKAASDLGVLGSFETHMARYLLKRKE